MLHPTRTNLLLLKEKRISVANSIGVLKSRRQALILEFIKTSRPYLESRKNIRALYGEGIEQLLTSLGHEGAESIRSICGAAQRDFKIEITRRTIWGLPYKEISARESAMRKAEGRGYDYRFTASALEETIFRFEKIVDAILDIAEYDNKLQRLSNEIVKTSRRMRVLEERILPKITGQIKTISQYIGERERETYFRLKIFKKSKQGASGEVTSPTPQDAGELLG